MVVSLCDIHWGNFNKFAKFVKMARVQRAKVFGWSFSLKKFFKIIFQWGTPTLEKPSSQKIIIMSIPKH
jgi:hypothetical protein